MMRTHITYDGGLFEGIRAFRGKVKQANIEAVEYWHEHYLPGHFKSSARQFYGYDKRSRQYQIRKAKTFGHQRDLVWTGTLERNAKRNIRVRGTAKRVTGIMQGTQALNFAGGRRGRPGYPDTRKEMTTVHPSEANRLGQVHGGSLTKQLNAPGPKRTVTVN